jgi:hypothetical protein
MALRDTRVFVVGCAHLLSFGLACSAETPATAISTADHTAEDNPAPAAPARDTPGVAASSAAPSAATDGSAPSEASTPGTTDLDAGEPQPSGPQPAPDASSGPERVVSIAGRWGMAGFEDPVGVEIIESGADGVLGGDGCAAGAPPVALQIFCGPLTGTRDAREAKFGFSFETYSYLAEVTISADGQRMAGRFHGASGFLATPTAWLRLDSDAVWLPQAAPDAPFGTYELNLLESATAGEDYLLGETYTLRLSEGTGISGHLGSFWWTEASVSAAVISVGPVAATVAELAVQMEILLQEGVPTRVQAVTAAGDEYSFEVSSL